MRGVSSARAPGRPTENRLYQGPRLPGFGLPQSNIPLRHRSPLAMVHYSVH
jgi:hypothetical protein